MTKFKDLSYSDVKAIYDFLEIRKKIIASNPEQFENSEIHLVLNKQKIVWNELHKRTSEIQDLTLNSK